MFTFNQDSNNQVQCEVQFTVRPHSEQTCLHWLSAIYKTYRNYAGITDGCNQLILSYLNLSILVIPSWFALIHIYSFCFQACYKTQRSTSDAIFTLRPPSTTIVPYANSLELDETPSNSASHPNPSCLTLRQHFHQLWMKLKHFE